jgi:D-alanine transfer protein
VPARGERRHLAALATSLTFLVAIAAATWMLGDRVAAGAVAHGVALPGEITHRGLTIQRAALRRDDALLLYGSSEIARQSSFRATEFFRDAPTGFRVVGVAARGMPLIITAYNLAALAPELRGRPVALSISHGFFQHDYKDGEEAPYLGTFSRLHASRIAFAPGLERALRQRVAERMLERDSALAGEPLLFRALRGVARQTFKERLAVAALLPMGRMQLATRELQDRLRVIRAVGLSVDTRGRLTPARPDWMSLRDSAERESKAMATNNPFGFDDQFWRSFGTVLLQERGSRTDAEWTRGIATAEAWEDLDLALDILTSAGARPLLLSFPYKGAYADVQGTTAAARRVYYDSLRAHAARARVPVRDFAEFERDRWFTRDHTGHPSPKGWIFYDQALDEFFHAPAP